MNVIKHSLSYASVFVGLRTQPFMNTFQSQYFSWTSLIISAGSINNLCCYYNLNISTVKTTIK